MIRWLRRPIIWLPISGLLIALVAWRSKVWEAGTVLGAPQPLPLVLAVLLNGLIVVLWAVRSGDLLGAAGRAVGIRPLLPMTAFANTINNLTPGSAGEVVRAWLLRAHHGIPYATSTAVIAIERVVAIGYMAGSAIVAWGGQAVGLPGPAQVALLILVAVTPGLVYRIGLRPFAAVGRLPLGGVLGREPWTRAARALVRVDATMSDLLTHPRHLAVFAVTTMIVFATYTAQLWLVAVSIGVVLDPVTAWGALGLATIAGVLSLLPFGLGATDLVLAALLTSLGVPPTAAGAIAFGYRLVATLPLGILGTVAYAWLSAGLPPGGTRAVLDAVSVELSEPAGESTA
ncbi:MAG TPA: lysylphosphatidylglycerol synthase transmembrane domain-containing protein [Candidatus Limnocylindrales bacterium]|nr:lysylphosphatidylglycerol synthase transmembrane domain-containing protein [Candidatus Limnocylindrales bacterium]